MILTFAAAPVIPLLVDREVQTFDVQWTVGMLEAYFVSWFSRDWAQFPAAHFTAPVSKELWKSSFPQRRKDRLCLFRIQLRPNCFLPAINLLLILLQLPCLFYC